MINVMENSYGIEKSIKAIGIAGGILDAVNEALEDKKITWVEWGKIGIKALGIVTIVKDGEEIYQEWQDYTDEEKATVKAAFEEEFNLANEDVEEIVEDIVGWIIDGFDIAKKIKEAKKQ